MIDFQKYDGIDFAKQIAVKLEEQDAGRFTRIKGLFAIEGALAADAIVHSLLFSGKCLGLIVLTLARRVKTEELDSLSPRINIVRVVDALFRMVITPFLFVRHSEDFTAYFMKEKTLHGQIEELRANLEHSQLDQVRLNLEIKTKEEEMIKLLDTHRELLDHLRELKECFDDSERAIQLLKNENQNLRVALFRAQTSRENHS